MLAIEVVFLSGRYTATSYNDRNRAEWPPHPVRVFNALVDAWADADEADPEERTALEWLEVQGAPLVRAETEPWWREVVTHYVPVNDARALSRPTDVQSSYEALTVAEERVSTADESERVRSERALEKAKAKALKVSAKVGTATGTETEKVVANALTVFPDQRGRQPRTFPTVRVDDPVVHFSWPGAKPSLVHVQALDRLLARVGRLGHSSSLVSCRLLTDEENVGTGHNLLVPREEGSVSLRVPAKGMLEALIQEFALHQGTEPRTLPTATARYGPHVPEKSLAQPALGGDWWVLELPQRPALRITRTLDLTRAVRGAMVHHVPSPKPEVITGHKPGPAPTAPSERPHIAVVPLTDVGHPHSDGTIHAVAIVMPHDATIADEAAVRESLAAWQQANGYELRLPGQSGDRVVLNLIPVGAQRSDPDRRDRGWIESSAVAGSRRVATTRWRWCRPSHRWTTTTPVALDRFPGDIRSADPRRRDRAEGLAKETIARACVRIGLPEPEYIGIWLDPPLKGVAPTPGRGSGQRGPAGFPPFKAGSSKQGRLCVHAEIEFGEPVRGPVLLGAGRYLGYGLFAPTDSRDRKEEEMGR